MSTLAITLLTTKLATGLYSYNALTQSEKLLLSETLRPAAGGFADGQIVLMTEFYLLAPSAAAIDALNQGRSHHLAKVQDIWGGWLTLATALTDCRDGETFAHARTELQSWPFVKRVMDHFPVREA